MAKACTLPFSITVTPCSHAQNAALPAWALSFWSVNSTAIAFPLFLNSNLTATVW